MQKYKKFFLVLFTIISLSLLVASSSRADDEDEREEDDDDNEEVVVAAPSAESSIPSQKTTTKTIIVKPAQIITRKIMQNVQLPDSDRDGLSDEGDPYPNIPLQIIVNDADFDGIDDQYEVQRP